MFPADPLKLGALAPATRTEARADLVLLLLALALGSGLRFAALGARELSADEAASWASAVAPTVGDVVRLQARLNPGKLPAYDMLLHGWILLFGDGLFAMRSLSALCGVLAIALVYLFVEELFESDSNVGTEAVSDLAAPKAGFAALLFALSLIAIKYSREARMYPLQLVAELIQIRLFVRVQRIPSLALCAGLALLIAICVAINFTASFLLCAQAAYLLLFFWTRRVEAGDGRERGAFYAALSLATGVFLFFLVSGNALSNLMEATRAGALQWIQRPPFWEPVALFNKATGTFAFPVIALAAAFGVIGAGRWRRDDIQFLLVWMWVPVVTMFALSLAVRPMFVERYVLSSFVPFLILAALGIAEIGSSSVRFVAATLCIALTLGHVYAYSRKPHDSQWREATAVAARTARPAGAIAVAPDYAVNVVRYYSAVSSRSRAGSDLRLVPASIGDESGIVAGSVAVLILGEQGVAGSERARLSAVFPRMLVRLRGVEVRARR